MHVVLVAPEIAPNTGNIIRLCANTGSQLHLVEPLGFTLEDRLLRRGGLDYHEFAPVAVYSSLDDVRSALEQQPSAGTWYAFSSGGSRSYAQVSFGSDDVLVFGAERAGLAPAELESFAAGQVLTIPMAPNNRSLNLANAVAVVVYEAWRQQGFAGASPTATSLTAETPGADSFDP